MHLAVLRRLSKVRVAELNAGLRVEVIAHDFAFPIPKRVDVASCGDSISASLTLNRNDVVLLTDRQADTAATQKDRLPVVQNQGVWILIGMVAALNVEVRVRSNACNRFANGGEKALYSLGRSSAGHYSARGIIIARLTASGYSFSSLNFPARQASMNSLALMPKCRLVCLSSNAYPCSGLNYRM